MSIEFDPAKAKTNLRKHGVSFAHAEQALRDPMALTIEGPDAQGEQRFVTIGMNVFGKLMVVVHTPRRDAPRFISVRKPDPRERRNYEKGV